MPCVLFPCWQSIRCLWAAGGSRGRWHSAQKGPVGHRRKCCLNTKSLLTPAPAGVPVCPLIILQLTATLIPWIDIDATSCTVCHFEKFFPFFFYWPWPLGLLHSWWWSARHLCLGWQALYEAREDRGYAKGVGKSMGIPLRSSAARWPCVI